VCAGANLGKGVLGALEPEVDLLLDADGLGVCLEFLAGAQNGVVALPGPFLQVGQVGAHLLLVEPGLDLLDPIALALDLRVCVVA
jgi:hypothetical protein